MAIGSISCKEMSAAELKEIYNKEREALAGEAEKEQEQDPVKAAAGSVFTLNLSMNDGRMNESDIGSEVESQLGDSAQGMLGNIIKGIMNILGSDNNDKNNDKSQEHGGSSTNNLEKLPQIGSADNSFKTLPQIGSADNSIEKLGQSNVTMNIQPTEGKKLDIEAA